MPLYFVLSETKEIKVELLVRQAKKYRWCYTIGTKNKPKMAYSRNLSKMALTSMMDHHGLSWTITE